MAESPDLHPAAQLFLDAEFPGRDHDRGYAAARQQILEDPIGYVLTGNIPDDYLLPNFVAIAPALDDQTYWDELGKLWVHHSTVHDLLPEWTDLFRSRRPCRECLMRQDERDELASLPRRVTIYRGYAHHGGHEGLAWTLDEEMARVFAERWAIPHMRSDPDTNEPVWIPVAGLFVASVVVPRNRIIALFRRERIEGAEVIVANLRGYRPTVSVIMGAEELAAQLRR